MRLPFAIGYAVCTISFETQWLDGVSVVDVESIRIYLVDGAEITDRLSMEGWGMIWVFLGWEASKHLPSANLGSQKTPTTRTQWHLRHLPRPASAH
jgi:hypothetical protein